jgi:glycerol-3-phosphate acyltransferase PlsY
MHPAAALGVAYLAGSFPTAYLAGRLLKGVDLRTIGSGNLGATNVYRNLGPVPAVGVLLTDALKGFVPVFLLPSQLDWAILRDAESTLWWALAIGVAAILGHTRPIFLLGRGGGKGVATAAGVFAALAPAAFFSALVVFVAAVLGTGFVSVASLLAAWTIPLAVLITGGAAHPAFGVSAAIAAYVTWAHRANVGRLRAGTEPRTFRRPPGGTE